MEIFRTDGGGKSSYDERLMRVFKKAQSFDEEILKKIDVIHDHKGDLSIHLTDECEYYLYDYIYCLFYCLWHQENDFNVTVFKNGVFINGYKN